MSSILNKGLWIVFIVLTPLTFVGLLSQNSIPGDILYPVKVGIDNVGSIVFSFTPETRASYSTSLTTRRFEEAHQLIVAKSDTQGLKTLITQTEKTQESLSQVQDIVQKNIIEEKFVQSIDTYQQKLTELQKTVDPQYIAPTPTPTVYIVQRIVQKISAVPTQIVPTLPPSGEPTPQINDGGKPQTTPDIINSIEETKNQLEEIKIQIQQEILIQSEQILPTLTIPQPTSTNKISPKQSSETKPTEFDHNKKDYKSGFSGKKKN